MNPNKLILDATDIEPSSPTHVVTPAYINTVAPQVAVPGRACNTLRRTPPANVVTNSFECARADEADAATNIVAIADAVAARKS